MMSVPITQELAAPLATVLRQVALGIAQAQTALDIVADEEAARRNSDESLPVLAFQLTEVELDLRMALTITRSQGAAGLVLAPLAPTGASFFRTSSYESRLHAKIGPRFLLRARAPEELG